MNFLAPLFLAGGAAVALPILFHLLRRRSREKVNFSSLMFLKPFPPKEKRTSRLTDLLLLALRCLVLCLLALGFARPYFHRGGFPSEVSQRGRRVLLLLDTSASMRRAGLWSQAKSRAESLAKSAGPGDQVALMTFDRNARTSLSFSDWASAGPAERLPLLLSRLALVEPGWNSTHLGKAMIAASESLVEAGNRDNNQSQSQVLELHLIGDLQESSRLDGLSGFEWPKGLEVHLETVKSAAVSNAGLQPAAGGGEGGATNKQIRVRVSNSGASRKEQFQIQWQGAGGPGGAVYVPPGQSRVVSAPAPPVGGEQSCLVLSGDDEPFDNTCFLIPAKSRETRILYGGQELETDSTHPLYYLSRAFQNYRRHDIRLVKPTASPAELADAKAGIATSLSTVEEATRWRAFVASGKTLLLALPSTNSPEALKTLLGGHDAGLAEADARTYAMLGAINFDHPVFAPFRDPRYNDFTKIHFWRHRRLGLEGLTNAVALARFDNGDVALAQVPIGSGTLLLLASGWTPAESQFALSSKFVPLLYSILEFAGVLGDFASQHVVGDVVDLRDLGAGPMRVKLPDGIERAETSGRFGGTDVPGLYSVENLSPPLRFAVNIDPAESKVGPLDVGQLQNLGVPLKGPEKRAVQAAAAANRENRLAADLEARQKNWRLLLLGALAFLLLESLVATFRQAGGVAPA